MAQNCAQAGRCDDCSCIRNKHIACAFAKSGGDASHCGNHGGGCHWNCSPPPGRPRYTPPKAKPASKPRIGRTNTAQGGQGWCDCGCRRCQRNDHCRANNKCKAPKPERGGGGGRGKKCPCRCTDCKNGVCGCGSPSCTG